ncbi:MAG: DUF2867 domain-containing protein [Catenulispora sp.]|nr:DUF2867 domain-containing protein [Catenulispora sp.]
MASRQTRRVPVPKSLLDGEEFAGSHYSWACELSAPDAKSKTAEQWGRAVFEGAPAPVRGFVVLGWTQVLRLRLGPRPSGEHILGWRISGPAPGFGKEGESLLLESRSGLITAYNVAVVNETGVLWATAVRFNNPVGRLFWRLAQPIHQLTIPRLLRRAARTLERDRA